MSSVSISKCGATLAEPELAVRPEATCEVEWYFVVCSGRVPAEDEGVAPGIRARALAVQGRLARLPTYHEGALSLRFRARVWPLALVNRFGELTSLVVRLESARQSFDGGASPLSRELDAVTRLASAIGAGLDARHLGHLRRRAAGYVRAALRAYADLDAVADATGTGDVRSRPRVPESRAGSWRRPASMHARAVTPEEEVDGFFATADVPAGFVSNFEAMVSAKVSCGPKPCSDDGLEERLLAIGRKRTILACLRRMPDHDAGVLQAAYEPRPWPCGLRRELGALTGLVVRLAAATGEWPKDRDRQCAREMEVAAKLEAARSVHGRAAYRRFWTSARAMLTEALFRYEEVRRGDALTTETVLLKEGACR
jgi:hypothetical protein